MALTNDPREDLAYLDRELEKPMEAEQRDRLLEHRQRAAEAVVELERGLCCPDCEGGPDECRCAA